ncbi:hypothetical protein RJ641_015801 [Dillenia turbinata]|uniref:Protein TRIGALACTOSYLDIACYLGLYCEROL 4, chloroplastic n=1 Tax=Dillenia turbinata TaxID=194707 RepID=A0AAN8UZN4_9MAGN
MASLRSAMDSCFWDQNIASPQKLDGWARSVPGEPFPLDGARGSKALRIQQLALLGNGFPLGIIPSFSPTCPKELGSFSLQTLLLKQTISDWWLGLVGQFRPRKLISSIKAELSSGDEWEVPSFKDVARHFLDKSLYSLGGVLQISLSDSSSLLLSTERHGEKKGCHTKAMLYHTASTFTIVSLLLIFSPSIMVLLFFLLQGLKLCVLYLSVSNVYLQLPYHDITLEAAWPELFIDQNGGYWEVPESVSLDLSSLVTESGLRYRLGIHRNKGCAEPLNRKSGEVPSALLPGVCAKAAFSYEKSRDLWRQEETKKDLIIKTPRGQFLRPAYDSRLKEPHSTISGIIGGSCAMWFGGNESSIPIESARDEDSMSMKIKQRSPWNADLFGSICYTFQHGKFRKYYGDLTRVDARLDFCSASALAKRVFKISAINNEEILLSSPKLNFIFQQQVAGPIVFRVDSRLTFDSLEKRGLHLEDMIYSLNYSLRLLQSGKVVAWYSPKRKEGMIELRLFEF